MDRVCPLLALGADGRTVVDGVDGGHRCHAADPPAPLERHRQSQLCLTPAHERCERYRAALARRRGPTSIAASLGDGFVTTRLLVAPEPTWRGIAGRARRAPPLVAIVAGAGAIAIAGIAVTVALLDDPARVGASAMSPSLQLATTQSPTATPSSSPTLRTAPSATGSPTATPSPSPAPTATPAGTAVPTPPATPVPTPTPQPQTYVVQEGDTLALIAQRFGTTVAALQAANGIDDPDQIVIGQVLVIP